MNRQLKFLLGYFIILISGILFMYWTMQTQQVAEKAAQWDAYRPFIEEMKRCLPYKPLVLCPEEKIQNLTIFPLR